MSLFFKKAPDKEKSMAGKFEVYKDKAGEFRFRLKAKNKQIIGTSQNYATAAARDNGVAAIGRAVPGAKVDDQA